MQRAARALRLAAGLAWSAFAALAQAAPEGCRVAFDLGSSGIRAGASSSAAQARMELDYLAPLWAGRGLDETLAPTAAALRQLPEQAGFDAACARFGGGFSAWRLALQQDPAALAAALAQLHAASGVAVLVIPQQVEGAYGHAAARQALGEIPGSHVLDIGGGSLQVAGERSSYGQALGQKAWHRLLCQTLRPGQALPCRLQPLAAGELAAARRLAAAQLQDMGQALGGPVRMTAISRPVSRGILPALRQRGAAGPDVLQREALSRLIDGLAPLLPEASHAVTASPPSHAAYLLSDMLLLEGLLQASGGEELRVAEADISNVPGLLADERGYAWAQHYPCYLQRLQTRGLDAYFSDPASCPPPPQD